MHIAGILQEEIPIEKMFIFSSKLKTSWPSGDIILDPHDNNI